MQTTPYNLDTLIGRAFQRIHHVPADPDRSLPSGLFRLDEATGPMKTGELVVATARRCVGTTAFSLAISRNISAGVGDRAPAGVLYLSLEETGARIVERLLALEAGVSMAELAHGLLSDTEVSELTAGCNRLHARPIRIDDEPADSMEALATRISECAEQAAASGIRLGLVVIDSLRLLGLAIGSPQRVSAARLATMLRETAAAHRVVVLATLPTRRREGWQGGGLAPLVFAADRVLVLERPAWYDPMLRYEHGEDLTVDAVRNRNGSQARVRLNFVRRTGLVEDGAEGSRPRSEPG
jgi:replicative DNA helicase